MTSEDPDAGRSLASWLPEDFPADHRLAHAGGDIGACMSVRFGVLCCKPLVTDALQSDLGVDAFFGAAELDGSSFTAALGNSKLLESAGLVP